MALRDKLRERSAPFLEQGEQIQEAFLGQTGPSPYWNFLTYLIAFWVKARVIVVTDRAVVLLDASIWTPAKPKRVLARLPRSTRIGPVKGLWGRTQLNGERVWIHKRFHGDVERADQHAIPA